MEEGSLPDRPDRPTRPVLRRRGSVKERFNALVDDAKRKEELRQQEIKNSRMTLKHISSVRGRWSEALSNMKVHENKRLEAVKAANKQGYEASGKHIVDNMSRTFDHVYVQKQLSESDRDRVDTRGSQGTLITINKTDAVHTVEAGTAYTVDVSACANQAALMEALLVAEDNELSMQVAIIGGAKEEPRIDVTSLAQLRADNSMVLGFLVDVHKDHEQDSEVYGDYRIDQYLPLTFSGSETSPVRRHSFAAALILQMRITLVPYGGWTFFHTRRKDPSYTIEKRQSKLAGFMIRPAASMVIMDDKSDVSPSSQSRTTSFSVQTSPCLASVEDGVERFGGGRSPTVSTPIAMTTHSEPEEEDLATITAEEARDAVCATAGTWPGEDEYVVVDSEGDMAGLDLAFNITPCLLYHECHKHRMIPSVMLHPDISLLNRRCVVCAWEETQERSPDLAVSAAREGNKALEFVCPDCAVFVCNECAYRGNGVIGSMETEQILLNSEVLFEGGYSTLKEESFGMLEQVGRLLLENPIPIRIEGHINTVKSSGRVLPASSPLIKVYEPGCDGQMLSERRAKMVSMYLQAMGVSDVFLYPVGCGGERPITRVKKDFDLNRYALSLYRLTCYTHIF